MPAGCRKVETKRDEVYLQVATATRPGKLTPSLPTTPIPRKSDGADEKQLEYLKLNPPTFNGDALKWAGFWKEFDELTSKDKHNSKEQRARLLIDQMRDPKAKAKAEGANLAGSYNCVCEVLQIAYNRPRIVYPRHAEKVVDTTKKVHYNNPMGAGTFVHIMVICG